jgi:hypothetical protein
MANLINQADVLTVLHNLMGHRVAPGGTDDDLKRFVQESFNYAWRYYKWRWTMRTGSTLVDGVLPADFDLDGYYSVADTYNVIWDTSTQELRFDPAVAVTDFTYQIAPPTLGTDAAGSAPFPSARVIALGAFVYAKKAENPTRADVQQEWDMFHSELDRLVGRATAHQPRRPVHYLDVAGTYVGDVGA